MTQFFYRTAALVSVLFFLEAGCGLKTPPIVPDNPKPEAVKEITATTRGPLVILSWPVPAKNVEGRELQPSGIAAFRIDRAEPGSPDSRQVRFRLYAEIKLKDGASPFVQNSVVTWIDEHAVAARQYAYRIRAIGLFDAAGPWSKELRVRPRVALAVPTHLMALAGDSEVAVSWETVTTDANGSPAPGFVGYNVYRGDSPDAVVGAALNKEPVMVTSFRDTTVANAVPYYYRVRSVDGPEPKANESTDSAVVSATPRDLTPPAQPVGLVALGGVDRIFLTWKENTEPDLAGYYVYRSSGSRDFERLNKQSIMQAAYSDESVDEGKVYFYEISAVDKSGNESPRSERKRAVVEKKP
jgi:hypothetical protein